MTDRLDLTNAFEAAGIERKAAEHLAAEIFDAIRENVATKSDIAELKADIAAVGGEMREMELRTDARIDRVVTRLGSLVVIIAGLLFAALHYWPPHG